MQASLHWNISAKSDSLLRNFRSFLCSHEGGSALVEMALALPLSLMVITGIFSFSVALNQHEQLSAAVTAGARTMAAERGDTDPCAATAASIFAAAPGLSQASLTVTYTLGGTNSSGTVTGGTSYTTNSCTAAGNGGAAALQAGWPAQVYATYPCTLGIYGVHLGSCTVKAKVTEVIQ